MCLGWALERPAIAAMRVAPDEVTAPEAGADDCKSEGPAFRPTASRP